MASKNEFKGYVKIPGKPLTHPKVRLDFNFNLDGEGDSVDLKGFSLRMFAFTETSHTEDPEISVTLSPEQWLDLIDSMKEEFESAQKWRKKMEE